jgi:hypothetical protein
MAAVLSEKSSVSSGTSANLTQSERSRTTPLLDQLKLPPADRERILQGNAKRLLHL